MEPFRIAVADDVLDDLSRRIRGTRWPEAEPVGDWSQGAPVPDVQEGADYWADRDDWRAR
ncbi:MAG: epoxide hydrolase N-terminal domain-containing protein, partial [Acidimicrobiales bacterium]